MKLYILTSILFDLLAKKKTTARSIAEKYGISERSARRYLEELSRSVPLYVKRGRNGGVTLPDTYRLPMGFMTEEEYEAAIEALVLAYSQTPQERFLEAKRKLSAAVKAEKRESLLQESHGNLWIDGEGYGVCSCEEKIALFRDSIKERMIIELEYCKESGEKYREKVEPHLLVFQNGEWLSYSFCRNKRDFKLLRLNRIISAKQTEDRFRMRPFEQAKLYFPEKERKRIEIRFEINPAALVEMQNRLGVDKFRFADGKWLSDVTMVDDERLIGNILSLGSNVRVLSPLSVKKRVETELNKLIKRYE